MKLAPICDFQQCGILSSVDSDKPLQPPIKLRGSKLCLVSSLVFKGPAKALIRLRVCAGWSEPLLVTHITLVNSCGSSNTESFYGLQCLPRQTIFIGAYDKM